jgi:hypothetical protein
MFQWLTLDFPDFAREFDYACEHTLDPFRAGW